MGKTIDGKLFPHSSTQRILGATFQVDSPNRKPWSMVIFQLQIPSGELTYSYGKWPFIVDFPIKNGDFPLLC